jgi:hypothetical protein
MFYVIPHDSEAEVAIRTMNFSRFVSFDEAKHEADRLKRDTYGLNYAIVEVRRVITTQTLAECIDKREQEPFREASGRV